MIERFPEQRNRSAQRRADADQVPASAADGLASLDDAALPVFDESFIAAAPVREPSAQARGVLARRVEPAADSSSAPRFPEPPRRWTVRPSHHLSAVRLPAVAAAVCALAGVALLLILLG